MISESAPHTTRNLPVPHPGSQPPQAGALSSSAFSLDPAALASLPHTARQKAMLRLFIVEEMDAAPNKFAASIAISERLGQRGLSPSRIRVLYYQFKRSGDLLDLVDKAAAPEFSGRPRAGLPAEFRTWVAGFLMLNQRGVTRERYRRLLERLEAWRLTRRAEFALPGYAEPPLNAPHQEHPVGWSYARLSKLRPTPFERAAIGIGRMASRAFLPPVYTTRVGMKVGQVLYFDDQLHDVRVNFPGNRKAQRPLELVCMDAFSACFVAHGFKPVTWMDTTETRVTLRGEDMLWFAVHWLTRVGWREDTGTLLVAEHGTACFPKDFQELVHRLTGGKVTFTAGGVHRRAACPGMFDGAARGNFRIKAGLESSFNLVRNETADLEAFPGQVGKDRLHAPEEWEARIRHNEKLLDARELMSPELAAELRLSFLSWPQFIDRALRLYDRLNRREAHKLEGWQAAGNITCEFRLPLGGGAFTPWMPAAPLAALPDDKRLPLLSAIEADPAALSRTRLMTPHEVWHRDKQELTRAPGSWLPLVLPLAMAIERRVSDQHLFEFEEQEISPGPLRFLAQLHQRMLRPGEKYQTWLNPWQPDELHLCDTRGRYLGACEPWRAPCKADVAAIERQVGRQSKIERELLNPVAAAAVQLARNRAADAQVNARLLAEVEVARPAAPVPEAEEDPLEALSGLRD